MAILFVLQLHVEGPPETEALYKHCGRQPYIDPKRTFSILHPHYTLSMGNMLSSLPSKGGGSVGMTRTGQESTGT